MSGLRFGSARGLSGSSLLNISKLTNILMSTELFVFHAFLYLSLSLCVSLFLSLASLARNARDAENLSSTLPITTDCLQLLRSLSDTCDCTFVHCIFHCAVTGSLCRSRLSEGHFFKCRFRAQSSSTFRNCKKRRPANRKKLRLKEAELRRNGARNAKSVCAEKN